jgi:tRNA-2-methylthio-N6-dimethylallyladenosine synthase
MDARLQILQALILRHQHARQAAMVGKTTRVLFEKLGRNPGQWGGKSEHLHAVHAMSAVDLTGQIRTVRVTATGPNSLTAELAD